MPATTITLKFRLFSILVCWRIGKHDIRLEETDHLSVALVDIELRKDLGETLEWNMELV
jgi:hypothetical protein